MMDKILLVNKAIETSIILSILDTIKDNLYEFW